MNLSGELIAILTTLCWSLGIFPFTEASIRIGTAPVNQYRLLFAWVIMTVILFFSHDLNLIELFTTPQPYQFVFLGLSGIIGFTIGDYCSFTSFKLLGPKLGSLYTTFAPGAALLIGYIALNETINLIGMFGILMTLAGVIWLTFSKKDANEALKIGYKRDYKGIMYGVVGALCQGTGLVLSKIGMDYYAVKLSVDSDKYQYKLAWLTALRNWLEEELTRYPKLVLLGDYNIAPEDRDVHDPIAWQGNVLVSEAERRHFKNIVQLGLHDSFRLFEQAEKSYSWWDYRMVAFRRNHGLRIDHILISEPLVASCKSCVIDKAPRKLERPSDHTPVVVEL